MAFLIEFHRTPQTAIPRADFLTITVARTT
jgi:hypothetical protein